MRTRVTGPTLETLSIMVLVFVVQQLVEIVATAGLFALGLPLSVRPWTLVTSVYAHGSLSHLVVNGVAILVLGLLIEQTTTRARFHAFVLGTGMLSGAAEVLVWGAVGRPVLVLGISGAAFALMGYLLAGNPVADAVLGRLEFGRRIQFLLVVALAGIVTYSTGGESVALVAHFTGFVLGTAAGRLRLLAPSRGARSRLPAV